MADEQDETGEQSQSSAQAEQPREEAAAEPQAAE